jgi:hypothetical protein
LVDGSGRGVETLRHTRGGAGAGALALGAALALWAGSVLLGVGTAMLRHTFERLSQALTARLAAADAIRNLRRARMISRALVAPPMGRG